MNANLAHLLKGLSQDELQEVEAISQYLQEKAGDGGSGQMAEGSVASLLNRASPRVPQTFQLLSDLMETPRVQPFAPKFSEEDHVEMLGLDPTASLNTKAALDGQHVLNGLQQRLGTDQPSDEPLTTREILEAAMEKHNHV